jgi:hypothetical protein
MTSYYRIAFAGLCAVALSACDAVKDVHDEPYTAIPPKTQLIAGTVVGLGTARPVVLSYDGKQDCKAPDAKGALVASDCKFYGSPGQAQSAFSFGSSDANGSPFVVGKPYTITVVKQPFGKTCTVANPTGTVGGTDPAPVVTCVNSAIPRYDLTVTIPAGLQTLPLDFTLTTEEGDSTQHAQGVGSVVFTGKLFNSQADLPAFEYKLTATTPVTVGSSTTRNFCTFTPQAGFNLAGRNRNPVPSAADAFVDDTVVVPTGHLTVALAACTYPVSVSVQFQGTPNTTPIGTGGVTLALRNHFSGVDTQTLNVAAFTTGTTSVAFGTQVAANSQALYELVVTQQPAGQRCVVFGTVTTNADTTSTATAAAGGAVNINAPTAGAVMFIDPDNTDWWTATARSVRCAPLPAAQNTLVGTYQMDARPGNQTSNTDGTGTLIDPPRAWGRPREFLTFFDDGTFLYGINANSASNIVGSPNSTFPASVSVRNNWSASSGVNHGFYAYNPATGTITFTIVTATDINNAGTTKRGLTGMPGYATTTTNGVTTGSVQATSVAKSSLSGLGTLSMTFTSGANTRLWTMTEPRQSLGELTGTWATADHLRSWIYDDAYTYAFHMGVNGMGNMQDACLLALDGSTQSSGYLTKHSGSASATVNGNTVFTCTPGLLNVGANLVSARNLDLPHYALKNSGGANPSQGIGPTTPRIVPGFHGRFPGMNSALDLRPNSPVQFEVTTGTPDTLEVQNTLNGVPVEQQITFRRIRPN